MANKKDTIRISDAKVIDLFCGIGGMTHGFIQSGFDVVAGIDNDQSCSYAFETNNNAAFIHKDIADVSADELNAAFGKTTIRVLIGCAPCQPFSSMNSKKIRYKNNHVKWQPLDEFARLIQKVKPEIVSMENVRDLQYTKKYPVFERFLNTLNKCGYHVTFKIVNTARYGIPQKRHRLVLLASRLGSISLIPETHPAGKEITVRKAISRLRPIQDGEVDAKDPLHRASKLNDINKKRIIATPHNGGSASDWSKELLPQCYQKESGKSYMASVYGRMRWDDAAPTMTTHCITLGAGRFGHPEQDRALSLREAALIQTFPRRYKFFTNNKMSINQIAKHIGNAVPVKLGEVIATSIKQHLQQHSN
ncbi:MAG: DNA (cytosine-5-)-methyltransferase [Candidatus Andersenbacteria bacterium]